MDYTFLFNAPQPNEAATDSSWVQVAKTGSFEDPRYGKFKITLADFEQWISNFKALAVGNGRLGLPVDVDHSPEKRGDTEAVGWVKELEKRSDSLWGRVEWNALGQELVGQKRYAYISPSYSGNYKDEAGKAHGTSLVGIALTNRPFLQMATVNLSRFTFAAPAQKGDGDADDVGLDPDDLTDLSETMLNVSEPERQKHAVVVKKVDGKTKHMFPIPPGDKLHARLAKAFIPAALKAGHITEADAVAIRKRADSVLGSGGRTHSEPSYSHRQMELDAILTALNLSREDLGVAADADEATVLSAIAKRNKPTPPEPPKPAEGVMLSQEQVTQLLADANAGRAAAEELRVNRFDTAFEKAQSDGKVVLAQKDTFKALYDTDSANALKLLSELQPVVQMSPQGVGVSPADLGVVGAQLAAEFTDAVTPMGIDQSALRLHAAALEIEQSKGISYEKALEQAEAAA